MHESQSRMWENLVGRSLPFWRGFFPRLQETFPDALGDSDADGWYREVNAVEPSLIRVEADEATYNLHIILRFELEQELLAGSFPLEQLPEEWNRRVWEYLGIEVPDDTRGVLQDVHWSGGSIGYFSTYALGNLISLQIWEKVIADLPSLADGFEQGEFGPLRDWLREHVHRYGRKFTPGRDARAGGRDEGDRSGAVRAVPPQQARRAVRDFRDRVATQVRSRLRRRPGYCPGHGENTRRYQRIRPHRPQLPPGDASTGAAISRSSRSTTSAI